MMNNNYFDKQKQEKALQWLEEKWPLEKRKCEICDNYDWNISQHIIAPAVFSNNFSLSVGGETYPQFMVLCNNCGNTKYINAVISGIVKVEVPDGK